MQRILKYGAVALLVLLVLTACEEELGPVDPLPDFAIEQVSLPARLNTVGNRAYDIAFRVIHPRGPAAVENVSVSFLTNDQATELLNLPLYDDGAEEHPDDGDVIARDGIFSNRFVPVAASFPQGNILLRVDVTDDAAVRYELAPLPITVFPNTPPQLLAISAPDTLYAGNLPVLFAGEAQDADSLVDLSTVQMRLKRGNAVITSFNLPLEEALDFDRGRFGRLFDSSFAAGRDSLYTVEFQAVDLSDDVSNTLSQSIFLENRPPTIANPGVRDSISLPPAGSIDTLHVKLSANDSQGLGDLATVNFTLTLIGGNTNGPFGMFDDGSGGGVDNGDTVPNDGRYSLILQLNSGNTPGTYVFEFQATDKVGQVSPLLNDTLVVLP